MCINGGLVTDQSSETTLECKYFIEHMWTTKGVMVKVCHGDNSYFSECVFINNVRRCLQRVTFVGVCAHHQNRVSKNENKEPTQTACTLWAYAHGHWPEYIITMLWQLLSKQYNIDPVNWVRGLMRILPTWNSKMWLPNPCGLMISIRLDALVIF